MIKSTFFESVKGDRKYTANDLNGILDGVISDGIFQNYKAEFTVRPAGGMLVSVGTGKGRFNGITVENDQELILDINENSEIVLEIDTRISGRTANITVNPEREADVHYYRLAKITLDSNRDYILESDIVSFIGTEIPYVTIDLVPNYSNSDSDSCFITGDLKITKNPDQSDKWLYCNGSSYKKDEYPNLVPFCPFQLSTELTPVPPYPETSNGNRYYVRHEHGYWIYADVYSEYNGSSWNTIVYIRYTTEDAITSNTKWNTTTIFSQKTTTSYSLMLCGLAWYKDELLVGVRDLVSPNWSRVYHSSDLSGVFDYYTVASSSSDATLYDLLELDGLLCFICYDATTRYIQWWYTSELGGTVTKRTDNTTGVNSGIYKTGPYAIIYPYSSCYLSILYKMSVTGTWNSFSYTVPTDTNWPTNVTQRDIVSVRYQEDTKKYYALMRLMVGTNNYGSSPTYLYWAIGESSDLESDNWKWSKYATPWHIYTTMEAGVAGYADGYYMIIPRNHAKDSTDNYSVTGYRLYHAKTLDDEFEVFDPFVNFPVTKYNGSVMFTHWDVDSYGPCIYAISKITVRDITDRAAFDVIQSPIVSVSGINYASLPSISSADGYCFIKGRN